MLERTREVLGQLNLEDYQGVSAYLFGSVARGEKNPRDIDIALVCCESARLFHDLEQTTEGDIVLSKNICRYSPPIRRSRKIHAAEEVQIHITVCDDSIFRNADWRRTVHDFVKIM